MSIALPLPPNSLDPEDASARQGTVQQRSLAGSARDDEPRSHRRRGWKPWRDRHVQNCSKRHGLLSMAWDGDALMFCSVLLDRGNGASGTSLTQASLSNHGRMGHVSGRCALSAGAEDRASLPPLLHSHLILDLLEDRAAQNFLPHQ